MMTIHRCDSWSTIVIMIYSTVYYRHTCDCYRHIIIVVDVMVKLSFLVHLTESNANFTAIADLSTLAIFINIQ